MSAQVSVRYKTRAPRQDQAQPGEPAWGNGCERRGCVRAEGPVFVLCRDGVARELCAEHERDEQRPTDA